MAKKKGLVKMFIVWPVHPLVCEWDGTWFDGLRNELEAS